MLTGGPGQRFVLLEGVVRILSSEFVKLKPACKEGVRCFLLSFTVREWKETLLIVSKAQDSGDICVLLISVSGGMGVTTPERVCFISAARDKDFPAGSRGHPDLLLFAGQAR